ncbi:FxsA family protein [Taklimakanibacter deserti]|uniref:FxsA family protein n=1 Tax=Taklimakanibacter deserti TaxID=2267839 RepID=UPI0013C449BB
MIRTIIFVLFALGLLELFLLVKTGQWFGAWFPVLAVILGFVLGGLTIRHTGIRSLNEVREASQKGYIGPNAAIAGMLGILAGILFILPGLLSDVAAILLLLPFMRKIVERRMSRPMARKGGVVIDGEAVEIHDDRLPPQREQEKNDGSPWNR